MRRSAPAIGLLVSMLVTTFGTRGVGAEGQFVRPELHAYRVRIEVVFGDEPLLTESVRERTLHDLRSRIRAVFGATWRADVIDSRERTITSIDRLGDLRPDEVTVGADAELDKVFVVAVPGRDANDPLGRLVVGGIELDVATGRLGTVVTRSTARADRIGATILAVVYATFSPLAVVERVEGDSAAFRSVAAGLITAAEDRLVARPGDTFAPYLRYFDKTGTLVRVQRIPSTYLRASETTGPSMLASIVSAYRAPLGTRINRRVEILALAVHATREETRVRLVRSGRAKTPAAGTTVEIVRKLRVRDAAIGEPFESMSDRDGIVRVPRTEGSEFSWLYVKSGRSVIARVPVLAGAESQVDVEVPDDRPRLEVEGGIDLLMGDLVDTVAKRETLLNRIQVLARNGDWDTVDELLPELDRIPTSAEFETRLDLLHAAPLSRARAEGNARAVFAIEKMVRDTRSRLRRFLDREKIEQRKADLAEERRFDEADGARLELD